MREETVEAEKREYYGKIQQAHAELLTMLTTPKHIYLGVLADASDTTKRWQFCVFFPISVNKKEASRYKHDIHQGNRTAWTDKGRWEFDASRLLKCFLFGAAFTFHAERWVSARYFTVRIPFDAGV